MGPRAGLRPLAHGSSAYHEKDLNRAKDARPEADALEQGALRLDAQDLASC